MDAVGVASVDGVLLESVASGHVVEEHGQDQEGPDGERRKHRHGHHGLLREEIDEPRHHPLPAVGVEHRGLGGVLRGDVVEAPRDREGESREDEETNAQEDLVAMREGVSLHGSGHEAPCQADEDTKSCGHLRQGFPRVEEPPVLGVVRDLDVPLLEDGRESRGDALHDHLVRDPKHAVDDEEVDREERHHGEPHRHAKESNTVSDDEVPGHGEHEGDRRAQDEEVEVAAEPREPLLRGRMIQLVDHPLGQSLGEEGDPGGVVLRPSLEVDRLLGDLVVGAGVATALDDRLVDLVEVVVRRVDEELESSVVLALPDLLERVFHHEVDVAEPLLLRAELGGHGFVGVGLVREHFCRSLLHLGVSLDESFLEDAEILRRERASCPSDPVPRPTAASGRAGREHGVLDEAEALRAELRERLTEGGLEVDLVLDEGGGATLDVGDLDFCTGATGVDVPLDVRRLESGEHVLVAAAVGVVDVVLSAEDDALQHLVLGRRDLVVDLREHGAPHALHLLRAGRGIGFGGDALHLLEELRQHMLAHVLEESGDDPRANRSEDLLHLGGEDGLEHAGGKLGGRAVAVDHVDDVFGVFAHGLQEVLVGQLCAVPPDPTAEMVLGDVGDAELNLVDDPRENGHDEHEWSHEGVSL